MSETGNVLLDTSVVIAHLRGVQAVTLKLTNCDRLFLPIVALGELQCGIRKSQRKQENLAGLQSWLRTVTLLSLTETTADHYARIKEELSQAGTPIPENDVWIAAHAREHGLPLATRDDHFKRISNLMVWDWR